MPDRTLEEVLAGIERRDFIKTTALAGAGLAFGLGYAPAALADPPANAIWAYPDRYSILPSESLNLHLAADLAPTVASISVYKYTQWSHGGWVGDRQLPEKIVAVTHQNNGSNNAAEGYAGYEDWNWPQTVTINENGDLQPGRYLVDVRPAGSTLAPADTCWVELVVRNPSPSSTPSILFKTSLNTFQAYNDAPLSTPATQRNSFYYQSQVVDGKIKITFRRPFHTTQLALRSVTFDYALVWWLQRMGYTVDFCTDLDVHLDTSRAMLSQYAAVISGGHDEYWSQQMYDNLREYRNKGGNLVFLSGNTCCWRVEYADDNTSLLCGKAAGTQDVIGPAAWWDDQATPPNPAWDNALVGVGTRNCAIRETPYSPPIVDASVVPYAEGYRVQNADHWIFDETDLRQRTLNDPEWPVIGKDPGITWNIIGPEGGGARITLNADDSAHLELDDGTPRNYALLGFGRTGGTAPDDLIFATSSCSTSPCSKWKAFSREDSRGSVNHLSVYAATMGYYGAYGSVFSVGTMNWGNALNKYGAAEPPPGPDSIYYGNRYLHHITKNVLRALTKRERDVRAVKGNLLFMQMRESGELSYWRMNGVNRTGAGSILYDGSGSPGKHLVLRAAASLSETGKTDLIFQHTDGHLVYWRLAEMTNGTIERESFGTLVEWGNPDWQFRVAIKVPVPGTTTPRNVLIYQHVDFGSLYYQRVDGPYVTDGGPFNPTWWDPAWAPVAALDLNGDGRNDLLFQNRNTRALYYWLLDEAGTGVTAQDFLGSAPTTDWHVVGAYDVTGNGTDDIIFQNRDLEKGKLFYWSVTAPLTVVPIGPLDPNGTMTPWFL
ncbi:MAG TPA: VCBS repeat-containing protein [Thermoanaerobaculia bacterium]|nr:VCBS repeat-containing protein [Thermoanaerobaculia bacterium]